MVQGSVERTLVAVVEQLGKAGYTETFLGERDGVRAVGIGILFKPEELRIERLERLEGVTDPDEEVIILALRAHGQECRGTYVLPFGKDMPSIDAELIARIPDLRTTGKKPISPSNGG